MFHVGSCPICTNGLRGIRVCCGRPVVLCDECDAVWASPDLADRLSASADPPCGECGESLWGGQAHWASQKEVEAAGWRPQVSGESPPRSASDPSREPNSVVQGVAASSESNGSLVLILVLMLAASLLVAFTLI